MSKPMRFCNDFEKEFGALASDGYNCPTCGEDHIDEAEYTEDNIKYPQCFNESKGATLDGNYWDWTELHCCSNCKTKFHFENGAY